MKYPQFFFDFTYRIAGPQAQTATQKKSKEFLGYVQEVFDIMTANGPVYTTCGSLKIQFQVKPGIVWNLPLISWINHKRSMLYIRC